MASKWEHLYRTQLLPTAEQRQATLQAVQQRLQNTTALKSHIQHMLSMQAEPGPASIMAEVGAGVRVQADLAQSNSVVIQVLPGILVDMRLTEAAAWADERENLLLAQLQVASEQLAVVRADCDLAQHLISVSQAQPPAQRT